MGDAPPIRVVSARELRLIFNNGGYWQKAKAGALREVIIRDGHPSAPKANEPFCTRSQTIIYQDKLDQWIAVVHQYLRQDGSLGASGAPDPKRLLHEGTLFEARG
ncbi:MAG: hypothetical protein M3P30_02960 [Chloroflexota bacterium]|nr:hypothetical protein [Chloroflexota bacterium]